MEQITLPTKITVTTGIESRQSFRNEFIYSPPADLYGSSKEPIIKSGAPVDLSSHNDLRELEVIHGTGNFNFIDDFVQGFIKQELVGLELDILTQQNEYVIPPIMGVIIELALAQFSLHDDDMVSSLSCDSDDDPFNYDKALRIALLSTAVGQEKKLYPYEMKELFLSGLYCDLGMIYIDPDLELDKQEAISSETYTQIRNHPKYSVAVLQQLDERYRTRYHDAGLISSEVLEGIYYHHEHPDGSGYYRQKQKKEHASLVNTASSFYAMINKGQTVDEAMQELLQEPRKHEHDSVFSLNKILQTDELDFYSPVNHSEKEIAKKLGTNIPSLVHLLEHLKDVLQLLDELNISKEEINLAITDIISQHDIASEEHYLEMENIISDVIGLNQTLHACGLSMIGNLEDAILQDEDFSLYALKRDVYVVINKVKRYAAKILRDINGYGSDQTRQALLEFFTPILKRSVLLYKVRQNPKFKF